MHFLLVIIDWQCWRGQACGYGEYEWTVFVLDFQSTVRLTRPLFLFPRPQSALIFFDIFTRYPYCWYNVIIFGLIPEEAVYRVSHFTRPFIMSYWSNYMIDIRNICFFSLSSIITLKYIPSLCLCLCISLFLSLFLIPYSCLVGKSIGYRSVYNFQHLLSWRNLNLSNRLIFSDNNFYKTNQPSSISLLWYFSLLPDACTVYNLFSKFIVQ